MESLRNGENSFEYIEPRSRTLEADVSLFAEHLERYLPRVCDESYVIDRGSNVEIIYLLKAGQTETDLDETIRQIHDFCDIVYAA